MNLQPSLCKPKRAKSAVRIRFTLPNVKGRHEVMTGIQVICNAWKNGDGRITRDKQVLIKHGLTLKDVELTNAKLHHAQTTLARLINEHQERSFPNTIDVSSLKADYAAVMHGLEVPGTQPRLNVISAFDKYVQRPSIKPYHKANLIRTQRKVALFIQDTSATSQIEGVNENWLNAFASYWMNNDRVNQQASSTLHSHLKRIRCVLMALDDEYTLARSLNRRIKLPEPTPVIKPTLNIQEIAQLASMKFDSATLSRTRDWFVIQCWTGIRRSDLMKLTMNDVKMSNHKWRICIYQNKTHGLIDIPLHPQAAAIIEKLGGLPRPMAPAHYGREIKTICRQAGFDEVMMGDVSAPYKKRGLYPRWKLISSHTARRSAATNLIKCGVSMDVACLLTGHSSVDQLGTYIQMTPRDKSKQLDAAIDLAV